MHQYIKVANNQVVNASHVHNVSVFKSNENGWRVRYHMPSGTGDIDVIYTNREDADKAMLWWNENYGCKKKGFNLMEGLKKYIADNRDLIYTVAFVAVLDQLLFEGAFRERIKSLVEGFLKKAEAKQAVPEV